MAFLPAPLVRPAIRRFTASLPRRETTLVAVLTACLIAATASSASAETLLMPSRDMLSGLSQVVWGVTTLPNHTTATPTNYSINFGDGTANATGNVTDRSYIAVNHTFPAGGSYTVTLTITRAGTTETATTVVRVFDATAISDEQVRAVRINSAIEDGLRYLWVNQASRGTNFPNGVTTSWSTFDASMTALIVLAFENHGYRLTNDDEEPTGLYEKYVVRRSLNYVIDQLAPVTLAAQNAGDPCVNVDDGPAPCVGLRQNLQSEGYATSLAILPLAASNALSRHVAEVTGSRNSGYVVGKTYGEVLQRLVNALAWGQNESGTGRGGWEYGFNTSRTDGSTIGWNVLALLDAAAAGITIPSFVKTEFVDFAIPFGLNNDGTFDYTSGNNPAVAQGAASSNMAKNGIGVQAMFYADMVGLGNARVLAGRNGINSRWNAPASVDSHPCSGNLHNKGCGYAMFNVFKALKLQGITTLPGVSRPAGPGTIPAGDWYADYVDWLLANQTAPTTTTGGHWTSLGFSGSANHVAGSVALAELVLSPVALIAPDPTLFATIGLGPTTALLSPGGTHTVTATATSAGGAPVPGATVNFTVLTGPNAGANGQGVTNAAGQTTFTYVDTGGPGRDTIRAFIGILGSNTVEALWQVPECSGVAVALAQPMYPLDQGWRPFNLTGVSGATVTQVCQDEPPNFENIAAWAVDANGVGTSAASVRAQRSGTRTAPGNGRVYTIFFTASSCSGQATIGVPTTAGGTATNDGARYDSVTGASCAVPSIPNVVAAPTFVGKTQAVAAAEAAAAGVQLTIESLTSPSVPVGIIVSQFPTAGTTVARGSSVVISVSTGPTSVAVPNVVGKPQTTATSQVTNAGLAPSVVEANDPVIAAGLVISQAPLGGTQVPPGSGVSLTVSLGPAVTTVPNVVNRILAGAVNSISGAGLNLGTVSSVYDETVLEGHVISQSPVAGTTVSPGSSVSIVLSLGPEPVPVTVPDVVGRTEAEARALILAASLVVGTIDRAGHATAPEGEVVSQTPAGGSTALPGSAVNIVSSLGQPPSVAIETPTTGSLLTTDVQVIGSVQDVNLRNWVLEYRVPGTSAWNQIGAGTSPVSSGLLGTFPATLVANNPYRIRLTAFDNGQSSSTEIEIQVNSSELKLGDFTLAYEDLRVPGLTFAIRLTRTYDTKRLQDGDFGPGWRLSFTDVDLRRAGNYDVFITLPTGRRVRFVHSPTGGFFGVFTNRYVGQAGVVDTLENTDCPQLFGGGGAYLCDGFQTYNPQNYRLRTKEGLTYTLTAGGGITQIQDRVGNTIDIAPTAVTTSWGVTVPITRDAQNRITQIGEPEGTKAIRYTYDAAGRLSEVRDQSDQPTTFFYEDVRFPNYLTRIVDPLGRPSIRTLFNDAGRLVAQCNANGNTATLEGCVRFDPDVAAKVQTLINARGFRTDLVLDDRGNVVTERRYLDDTNFQDTVRTYDSGNNLLTETDPAGGVKRFTYDAHNNTLTDTGPDGRTTRYTYNACDAIATETDPADHTTTYGYDALCHLTAVTDALGKITRYEYNARGQRTAFIDAIGSRWAWIYDVQGRLTSRIDPFGKATLTTFNTQGDLLNRTDRNGRRIDFGYDANHRLTTEIRDSGQVTSYGFDPAGNLTSAVDPDSALTMTYTTLGQVRTVDNQSTDGVPRVVLTYGYDVSGNITSVADSLGGVTSYMYDSLDRLSRVSQSGVGVNEKRIDIEYNAAGVLTAMHRYSNVGGTAGVSNTFYEYECPSCPHRLSAIRHRKAFDNSIIHDLLFGRDDVGNILTMADADGFHSYTFDALGRLRTAAHSDATLQPAEFYSYDAVGNRLISHLDSNLIYSYMVGSNAGNQLLLDSKYSYEYDGEGNVSARTEHVTGARTIYNYTYSNRLESIIQSVGGDPSIISYSYDALGRRIRKVEGLREQAWIYDGLNPVVLFNSTTVAPTRWMPSRLLDSVVAIQRGSVTDWVLTDHVNSPRTLVSDVASPTGRSVWSAFGSLQSSTGTFLDAGLAFNNREFSSTGLIDARTREHSVENGRYLQEDPLLPFGYAFAKNNPMSLRDPMGLAEVPSYSGLIAEARSVLTATFKTSARPLRLEFLKELEGIARLVTSGAVTEAERQALLQALRTFVLELQPVEQVFVKTALAPTGLWGLLRLPFL